MHGVDKCGVNLSYFTLGYKAPVFDIEKHQNLFGFQHTFCPRFRKTEHPARNVHTPPPHPNPLPQGERESLFIPTVIRVWRPVFDALGKVWADGGDDVEDRIAHAALFAVTTRELFLVIGE